MSGAVACLPRGLALACLAALMAAIPAGRVLAQPGPTSPPGAGTQHPHHRKAQPPAPAKTAPPAPPAPPAENLVVHGARRYQSAPVPNQAIHDPAEAMRDPSTGAPIGRFGHAYMDANPVPPVNPGLQGDQGPIAVGVQR